MKFSDVQEKEVIAIQSGKFIGFIEDAEINVETGFITAFHVVAPKKWTQLFSKEQMELALTIEEVITIGKDVVLIDVKQINIDGHFVD